MSIADLATGDTVDIQADNLTTDDDFGQAYGDPTDVRTDIECRVDTMSGSDARKYGTIEARYLRTVYFTSDLELSPKNQLKWKRTKNNNHVFSTPKYLRVLDYYPEFDPDGELELWIADCSSEPARQDDDLDS